jgi:hypothetical protein
VILILTIYEICKIWGELARSLKSETIGDRDLFIASIALANKQTLVTKNKKHFERVPFHDFSSPSLNWPFLMRFVLALVDRIIICGHQKARQHGIFIPVSRRALKRSL